MEGKREWTVDGQGGRKDRKEREKVQMKEGVEGQGGRKKWKERKKGQ